MIPERTPYEDEIEVLKVFGGLFLIFLIWAIWTLPAPAQPIAPVIEILPTPTITYAPTSAPTPDPVVTMAIGDFMLDTGGIPMGEWLSWERKDVDGLKDMSTHVTVYGYKMLGTVDWWSASWGQYFKMGAGDGQKFFFVFINSYSDENMSRMWGIQENQFALQVGQQVYSPSQVLLPEIRLKQFDEIWDLQHVENVKPYGYIRYYDTLGHEATMPQGYIKAGKSNAWDGYIVFVVPKDTKPQDCKVLAQFGNLMEPHWWKLR